MVKTRDDLLTTNKGKLIGKQQFYGLVVDGNRDPVLDADGNEQLVDLEIVNGRLRVDASITGSLTKGKETRSIPTTVGGTALASIPSEAIKAFITVENADIRYWVDGSAPTSTTGHKIYADGSFELDHADQITNFKAIGLLSTATLQVSYF